MEDRDWLILSTLYQEKNITRAAQTLFISQPALTTRLQHIEKYFGVTIVQRTRKGVHFTSQGEFLAKTAGQMLQTLRDIKEQVLSLNEEVMGTLSIGASNYFTTYTLPPLLCRFKQLYPLVEYKVATTWSREIFNLVYNQQVHVGFVSSDYGGANEKILLYQEEICVASINPLSLPDLPHLPRIDYQSDALIKAQVDRWWRENFSQPPLISMEVDKLATCKQMVSAGLGYAIMPARIVRDIPDIHTFPLLDSANHPLLRKTWMIYRPDAPNRHILKAFTDFIKTYDFSL